MKNYLLGLLSFPVVYGFLKGVAMAAREVQNERKN